MYDLIIIGAGPAGLFAAKKARQKSSNFILLDTFDKPGGSCFNLLTDSLIYDPAIEDLQTNREFITSLLEDIKLEPNHFLTSTVKQIERSDNHFTVITEFYVVPEP